MTVTTEMIKELRQRTGAGILDCKKALEATNGDAEKAIVHLREKGLAKAAKKAGRQTNEGIVEPYVHPGGRVGSLVELNCETDFVARTPEFKQLAHDLAMQIVAASPQYLKPEDVPQDVLDQEKAIYVAEYQDSGKPEHVLEKIAEGRLQKYYAEVCLLKQPFIKENKQTIEQLIQEAISKLGENIIIRRFARYELGK